MSERTYEQISSLPDAITPLTGAEYCEIEQNGVSRKVQYGELGGVPSAHAASHKIGGSDPVGTQDRTANAIPVTDGSGTLNEFLDRADTSTLGLTILAADGESDASKPMKSDDPRASDSRNPTAHASSHLEGGVDPLGLKSAAFIDADVDNGVPVMVDGLIQAKNLPPLAIKETYTVSSESAMLALAAQTGDVAIRTDINSAFILAANDPTVLENWVDLTPGTYVLSLDGEVGVVSLRGKYVGYWFLSKAPYSQNEVVAYGGRLYYSTENSNSTEPGATGAKWALAGGSGEATNAGYNLTNGQIEFNIDGYDKYSDTPGIEPVSGSGSGTITITTEHNTLYHPPVGAGCLLMKKYSNNAQGQGIGKLFSIDDGLLGEPCEISFVHSCMYGPYVDGGMGVYVYDVTNGVLIPTSNPVIASSTSLGTVHKTSFTPSRTSKNYRLIWHIRTTSTQEFHINIDDVQVGAKVGSSGAVIGDWKTFTPGAGITNLPGSWGVARYRRNGDSVDMVLSYAVSGAATGNLRLYGDEVLSSLGLTASVESLSIPGVVCNDASASAYYVGMWNPNNASGLFRGPSGGGWNATVPFTWASGDIINITVTLPISQWAGSGTVGLVQGYEEYASNSDVSATPSVTGSGFLQGFGNFGGFGSGWAVGTIWVRRVKFQQPIQRGRDEISIGLALPTDGLIWDRAEYSSYMIAASAFGNQTIGFKVDLVAGDPYSADVSFFAGGRKSSGAYGSVGSPWSGLTGFEWFAKKTSAGKPGETLPLVRAEVNTSSARSGSAYILFSNEIEDPHSCFSTATGVFTPAVSGILHITGNLLNSTTAACTAYVVKKRGGSTIQTKIVGRTDVANSRIMCRGSIRVEAGDEIALYCDQATAASVTAEMTFEIIGR